MAKTETSHSKEETSITHPNMADPGSNVPGTKIVRYIHPNIIFDKTIAE